ALALIALVAPLITPYDPIDMDLSRKLQPPGGRFPLGTDEFGRDILSRIILGSRISLQVGLISVGIAAIFGTVVGLVAGYFGGWFDMASQRILEVMLAFPGLLL